MPCQPFGDIGKHNFSYIALICPTIDIPLPCVSSFSYPISLMAAFVPDGTAVLFYARRVRYAKENQPAASALLCPCVGYRLWPIVSRWAPWYSIATMHTLKTRWALRDIQIALFFFGRRDGDKNGKKESSYNFT